MSGFGLAVAVIVSSQLAAGSSGVLNSLEPVLASAPAVSASETKVAALTEDAGKSAVAAADALPKRAATEPTEPVKTASVAPVQTAAAVSARSQPAAITLEARVDQSTQTMTVVANGTTLHTWPISSGTASHPTPRGTFRAQWMAADWHSRTYDMAPMPHSVFFKDGAAIHGTDHLRALGRPASKGCVRLSRANAQTFFNLVRRHGLRATRVSVTGTLPAPTAVARNNSGRTAHMVRASDTGASRVVRQSRYGDNFAPPPVHRAPAPSASSGMTWPGDAPRATQFYRARTY